MQSSRLSIKNQVALPKEVRQALGASPGDMICFQIEGNVVSLKRLEPFEAEFHQMLSSTLNEWASAADEEAFDKNF